MELLFKRDQSTAKYKRVDFKLWSKIEPDEEEQALIDRYSFHDAVLIEAIQPTLIRNTLIVAGVVFAICFSILISNFARDLGIASVFLISLVVGIVAGYWYLNEKRETIFVRDLLHGRYFACKSVVELARKEAWLETIVAYLRQVMESAKHWDGTARHKIEPLPKDEARQVILKGL